MSDNKKREGNSSASTPKSSSRGAKSVCEKLTKIFTLVSELKDDPASFQEHEAIVANRDSLKKQLDEKDENSKKAIDAKDEAIIALQKEIDNLKTEKDVIWKEFDSKCAKFIKKTGDHESLQKQLKKAVDDLAIFKDQFQAIEQANEKANKGLEFYRTELENSESRIQSLDQEREHLSLELKTGQMREQQRNDFLGLRKLKKIPPEDFTQQLEDLAGKCHRLAFDFFQKDISDADLEDIIVSASPPKELYLSSSSTPAARLMRCAFAESVIASAMTYHVFADIPFPKQPNVQWSIRTVLDSLGQGGNERQKIVRCQLLAEYAEEQDDEETHYLVIDNVVRECAKTLHPLLKDSDAIKFKAQLQDLCREALRVWSPLKWSTSRIVADCSPKSDSYVGEDFDDVEITLTDADEKERRVTQLEPLLQLFPQILADNKVLMEGYVLLNVQKAVFSSKKAATHKAPPPPLSKGHPRLNRTRTDSITQSSLQSPGSGHVALQRSSRRQSKSGSAVPFQSPPASPTTDRRNGV